MEEINEEDGQAQHFDLYLVVELTLSSFFSLSFFLYSPNMSLVTYIVVRFFFSKQIKIISLSKKMSRFRYVLNYTDTLLIHSSLFFFIQ